jgi:hypothetical protein
MAHPRTQFVEWGWKTELDRRRIHKTLSIGRANENSDICERFEQVAHEKTGELNEDHV